MLIVVITKLQIICFKIDKKNILHVCLADANGSQLIRGPRTLSVNFVW